MTSFKPLRGIASCLRQASSTAIVVGAAMLTMPVFAANSDFTASYKGGTTSCGTTYQIKGVEPVGASKKPVFIYMVGTNEKYDNASAMAAIQGMANRGYVAATVEYASAAMGPCTSLTTKSKCVFDKSSAQSAVSVICSRSSADCSKGIVVGGFSQGSLLAILSKNYDSRVQAVYGMGTHKNYIIFNPTSCAANGNRVLPQDRLRVINGENDFYGGGTQNSVRSSSQVMTGYQCSGTSCLQPDGSGWRMVLKSEVQDGSADHCYMRAAGCLASENNLDVGWISGADEWELNANLDWLSKFTAK